MPQSTPKPTIYQNPIIIEGLNVGGVAGVALQPPDEALALIGQSVDRIQLGHKIGHERIVKGSHHPGNVDLGWVIGCLGYIATLLQ